MQKYIILVNEGVYYSDDFKNTFSRDDLVKEMTKWSQGEQLMRLDDDEDESIPVTLDEMIKSGDMYILTNKSMVEMGDDQVHVTIVKVKE